MRVHLPHIDWLSETGMEALKVLLSDLRHGERVEDRVVAGQLAISTPRARTVLFHLSNLGAVDLGWFAFVSNDPTPVDWLPFGQELELPFTLDNGKIVTETERDTVTYELAFEAKGPVYLEQ